MANIRKLPISAPITPNSIYHQLSFIYDIFYRFRVSIYYYTKCLVIIFLSKVFLLICYIKIILFIKAYLFIFNNFYQEIKKNI